MITKALTKTQHTKKHNKNLMSCIFRLEINKMKCSLFKLLRMCAIVILLSLITMARCDTTMKIEDGGFASGGWVFGRAVIICLLPCSSLYFTDVSSFNLF